MKETKENKQTEQQEVREQQVICCNGECLSRKHQLISIRYTSSVSELQLLCENCGMFSIIQLGAGIENKPIPKHTEKMEGRYLG